MFYFVESLLKACIGICILRLFRKQRKNFARLGLKNKIDYAADYVFAFLMILFLIIPLISIIGFVKF